MLCTDRNQIYENGKKYTYHLNHNQTLIGKIYFNVTACTEYIGISIAFIDGLHQINLIKCYLSY